MLRPGRYTFQHRVEGEGHFVHFTELGGTAKAHPGEVSCRLEPLGAKAKRTAVYTSTEGGITRITKIVVAGENVAHLL